MFPSLAAIGDLAFLEMGCDQRSTAEENKWMIFFIAYFGRVFSSGVTC